MLQRLSKIVTTTLSSFEKKIDPRISQSTVLSMLSKKQIKLAQAYLTLEDSIRELSSGQKHSRLAAMNPSFVVLKDKNIDELNQHELEMIATIYFHGNKELNIEKDLNKSMKYFSKAMDMGSKHAKYSVAVHVKDGSGTTKDSVKAFQMFTELVKDHNYPLAHYALAVMYSTGQGTAVDHQKAFYHNTEAMKTGIVESLRNVANAYATGVGVEKDDYQATKHYEVAVLIRDTYSMYILSNRLYQGIGTQRNEYRSLQLLLDAANGGIPQAMFNLGCHYLSGEVIPKDLNKARQWFEKAAFEQNFPEAGINLATMYFKGIGVEKDLDKAIGILNKFAVYHKYSRKLLVELQYMKQEEEKEKNGKVIVKK